MKGLCRKCFTSNVEVKAHKKGYICKNCSWDEKQ